MSPNISEEVESCDTIKLWFALSDHYTIKQMVDRSALGLYQDLARGKQLQVLAQADGVSTELSNAIDEIAESEK